MQFHLFLQSGSCSCSHVVSLSLHSVAAAFMVTAIQIHLELLSLFICISCLWKLHWETFTSPTAYILSQGLFLGLKHYSCISGSLSCKALTLSSCILEFPCLNSSRIASLFLLSLPAHWIGKTCLHCYDVVSWHNWPGVCLKPHHGGNSRHCRDNYGFTTSPKATCRW